jgi:hypothetical protein
MLKVNVLPVSFVGIALLRGGCDLAPSHSAESGDRPPDGGCPGDRPCSSASSPLYFTGTTLGDALDLSSPPPRAIAVGGTETIAVWTDRYAKKSFLPEIADETKAYCKDSASHALAFCVLTGGETVKGEYILMIPSITPPMVRVLGQVAGEDKLRITASDSAMMAGTLYDQIPLDVIAPTTFRVVPVDPDFRRVNFFLVDEMPIAFAVGSRPPAVVVAMSAIVGGQAVRIVDESVSLTPSLPYLSKTLWDTLVLSDTFHPTQDSSIMVTTQGQSSVQAKFKIVDKVTSITLASNNDVTADTKLVAGNTYQVCLSSFYTDDMGTDWLVYGARLVFTAWANVSLTPVPGAATSQFVNSCIYMQPTMPGRSALFYASYGDHSGAFVFDVCPATGC